VLKDEHIPSPEYSFLSVLYTRVSSLFSVKTVLIHPNQVKYVNIIPGQMTRFELGSIRSDTGFIIFQVHTYRHRITLSFTPQHTESMSVTGRDVGVVTIPKHTATQFDWYVTATHGHSSNSFRTLVLASLYNEGGKLRSSLRSEFWVFTVMRALWVELLYHIN